MNSYIQSKRHQNSQLKTRYFTACLFDKYYTDQCIEHFIFLISLKGKNGWFCALFALSNRLENTNIWDILLMKSTSFYARCFFLTRGFYRMFHNSRFVFWGSNCSEGWKLMLFSMKSSIPFHCWNISYQPPRSLLSNSKL